MNAIVGVVNEMSVYSVTDSPHSGALLLLQRKGLSLSVPVIFYTRYT